MTPVQVGQSDWTLRDGKVTKVCGYTGLLGDDRQHAMLIEIDTVRSHSTGLLEPGFTCVLDPDPLPELAVRSLSGQLVVPSTPFDPDPAHIVAEHAPDGTLVIKTASVRDAEAFVQTISAGEDMRLVLFDRGTQLLELPIPNDTGVVRLLRKALE